MSSDASAELAGQAPNIVVPVNQSSDSVDRNINFETGDITGSTTGDINIYDEIALTGGATNTGGLTTLTDKIPDVLKPSKIGFALNLAKPGLGVLYNLIQAKKAIERQAIVDEAETARLADTPENAGYATESDKIMAEGDIAFAETGDYDVYSDTPTGTNIYTGAPTTYSYEGSDEQDEATNYAPEPTYTAPPAYQGSPAYSGSDSGSDNGGSMSSQDEMDAGGRGSRYAVGGIVRLRKNKQNSRIHDRRKRLAMGGIASLHG